MALHSLFLRKWLHGHAILVLLATEACGARSSIDELGYDSLGPSSGSGGASTAPQSMSVSSGGSSTTGTLPALGGQTFAESGGQNAFTGGHSNYGGSSSQVSSTTSGANYGGSSARVIGSTSSGGQLATGGRANSGGSPSTGGNPPDGGRVSTGGATVDDSLLIDDMENGSGFIRKVQGRQGAWYAFGATTGSQWPEPTTPGTPIETTKIPGGRAQSLVGMYTYGHKTPYGGIGFDLNYDGASYGSYDASAYGGIDFWARGSASNLRVRLSTIETTSTSYGGTCTLENPPQEQGCQAHYREIILGDDWSHYWIPFASLPTTTQGPDYKDIAFRRDQLTNVQFYASGTFDFWVDDVSFFVGEAGCCSPLPMGCDANLTGMNAGIRAFMNTGTGEPTRCEDVCFVQRLEPIYGTDSYPDVTSLDGLQCAISLRSVILSGKHITDLKPLSNATHLASLILSDNQIQDITALQVMTSMDWLDLSNNQIRDILALSNLNQLQVLKLANNQIESITGLGADKGLIRLDLSTNRISDIIDLKWLTQLTTLGLGSNQVKDLSALGSLTQLTSLGLSDNYITSVEPLSALKLLTYLDLSGNSISAIDALSTLTTLTSLHLGTNNLSSVDALSTLTALTTLDLSGNDLRSIDPLTSLTHLKELHLDSTAVSDFWPLSKLANLTALSVSNNSISDLSPLGGLSNLSSLDASHNLLSDANAIATSTGISWLNLSDNQISDLSFLANRGCYHLDLSANRITKLDQLLTFDWVTRRVNDEHVSYAPFYFDFSGNPIDCAEQAANIAALRGHVIELTVDCP